jgi:hypothetical protein
MPALVAGIHTFLRALRKQDVDGRDKPGHDEPPRAHNLPSTFIFHMSQARPTWVALTAAVARPSVSVR